MMLHRDQLINHPLQFFIVANRCLDHNACVLGILCTVAHILAYEFLSDLKITFSGKLFLAERYRLFAALEQIPYRCLPKTFLVLEMVFHQRMIHPRPLRYIPQ